MCCRRSRDERRVESNEREMRMPNLRVVRATHLYLVNIFNAFACTTISSRLVESEWNVMAWWHTPTPRECVRVCIFIYSMVEWAVWMMYCIRRPGAHARRERDRGTDDWASMSFKLVAFIILWPSDCGKSSFNIFEWARVEQQQRQPAKSWQPKFETVT